MHSALSQVGPNSSNSASDRFLAMRQIPILPGSSMQISRCIRRVWVPLSILKGSCTNSFHRKFVAKENKWLHGNTTQWHDEAYDKAFHVAEGELDPVKRAALFIAITTLSGWTTPSGTLKTGAARLHRTRERRRPQDALGMDGEGLIVDLVRRNPVQVLVNDPLMVIPAAADCPPSRLRVTCALS